MVEAAADGTSTEIILILSDETDADKILLDFEWNSASLTASGTADSSLGWGREMYTLTKDSSNSKRFKITVNGSVGESEWAGLQFIFVKDGSDTAGYKYKIDDDKATFNNNGKLYFQINVSDTSWPAVSPTTTDPSSAQASDIMAIIDEIGTVELTASCLAKIEAAENAYNNFEGNKASVTNYSTLTAARAKYNELQAAADAAAAGKVTFYVKNANWNKFIGFTWDRDNANALGAWPGTELTAVSEHEGWYVCTVNISKETNFIFSNGTEQTLDINNVKAGTYWLELSAKDGEKYAVDSLTTTAPAGWNLGGSSTVNTGDASSAFAMFVLAVIAVVSTILLSSKRKVVNN